MGTQNECSERMHGNRGDRTASNGCMGSPPLAFRMGCYEFPPLCKWAHFRRGNAGGVEPPNREPRPSQPPSQQGLVRNTASSWGKVPSCKRSTSPHPSLQRRGTVGPAQAGLKKVWGGSISRILFRIDRAYGGDHVSTAYVAISFQRPTREPWPGRPFPNVTDSSSQTAFAVRSQAGRSDRPPIWSCSG